MNSKRTIQLNEKQFSKLVVETAKRILTESFNHWNSSKVVDAIKEFGINSAASMYSNYLLTQLNDDDFLGLSDNYVEQPGQSIYSLSIGSNKFIVFTTKHNKHIKDLISGKYRAKKMVRPHNELADDFVAIDDKTAQLPYRAMTTRGRDARELRQNPYFLAGRKRSYDDLDPLRDVEWNEKTTRDAMDNLRRGKDRFGNDNKKRF